MSLLPVDASEASTGSTIEHAPPLANTEQRDPNPTIPEQQQTNSTHGPNPVQTGELRLDVVPTEDQAPPPPPAPVQTSQPPQPQPPTIVLERPSKPMPIKPIETAKTPTRRVSPFRQAAAAGTTAAALRAKQPARSDDGQKRPHRAVTFVSPAASSQSSQTSVISQHRHAVFSSEGPPASVAGMDSQIFFKDCWVCCCECPVWVGLFVFLMICLILFTSFFFWPKTITLNDKPNTYFMQPVDQHYDTVHNSHDFVQSEPSVQSVSESAKYT